MKVFRELLPGSEDKDIKKNKVIVLGVTSTVSLRLISGFAEFLADSGWEVHLVHGGDISTEIQGLKYSSHIIEMNRNPNPSKDLLGLVIWTKFLRKIRPDVVLVGTPKAGLLGIISATVCKVPVRIYQLRGLRLETISAKSRWLYWILEFITCQLSTQVLCVSPSLRELVVKSRLVPRNKTAVMLNGSSNGISAQIFEQKVTAGLHEISVLQDKIVQSKLPVIGFVGRLHQDKGILDLADAIQLLAKRNIACQLLVVGEQEQIGVAEAIGNSQIPVTFTGFTKYPEAYYQLMDIFCLPTLREGFPNVVLEASLASKPTITTNATGAVDSVIDQKTGLVVPTHSPVDLAMALEVLLSSKAKTRQYGVAAKTRALEFFDQQLVWQATTEYLNGLLAND